MKFAGNSVESGMEDVCRVDQSRATCSARGGGILIVTIAACFTTAMTKEKRSSAR